MHRGIIILPISVAYAIPETHLNSGTDVTRPATPKGRRNPLPHHYRMDLDDQERLPSPPPPPSWRPNYFKNNEEDDEPGTPHIPTRMRT